MIKTVDENFKITEINPFTDLPYDGLWTVLCLTDTDEYQMMNGGELSSAYVLKISKRCPHWETAVMDFISYNENLGKNIILSISENDYSNAKELYTGHSYNEPYLRDFEPRFLVHSTTQNGWQGIKSSGCLKSWNRLKQTTYDFEQEPIGKKLGDPDDFSDYIMFSGGGVSGEIIVASKQKGFIDMNVEARYTPGVRLYFDAEKIAENGLLIRDGAHLKVRDELPLEPYLIFAADWQSIGLKSNLSTPKEFAELADNTLERKHK